MTVSFDIFTAAFLNKVTEYRFCRLPEQNRQALVDGYMKAACSKFSEVCAFNISTYDGEQRCFELDDKITQNELDEIVEIVSEGMLVQWMKPYMYQQQNLENMLNMTDFSAYSPAELLHRVVEAYNMCKADFTNMMREYSYRHADLRRLHQ